MLFKTTFKVFAITIGSLFLVAAGCLGKADPPDNKAKSSSMPLPLKVVGNQILNSDNKPVTLRGVNAASLEWTSDGNGQILETVRVAIDDWHVNIIRLPLSQDRWFGKSPEQNDVCESYRALIKQVVDLCASKGCYILLDLHWSDVNEWGQNIGQHSMPDRNSVIFWKDFAPVYANNPAVLFDLYNEPHDVTWDVWLKGGMITDRPNGRGQVAKKYEAVGMQEMLDTIRAAGAKNVIVAGGLEWAYDFNGILDGRQLKDPKGNGVIYANHAYDNKGETVFTWIASMEEATAKFPVIVSEFGGAGGPNHRSAWWGSTPSTAIGDDWLLHVLQAIQDHNWSFTAWDLHTAAGPTLIADWNYMPTPEFGVYVKELLVKGKLPTYTPPDLNKIAQASASTLPESARAGAPELYGDWQLEPGPGERQGSILAFSADDQGKLVGQWINSRGVTLLEDVRSKDNAVTFSQTATFRKGQFKASFAGSIENNKLSGNLTHGATQSKINGKRPPKLPPVVGNWEINYKINDRDITATLVVTDVNGKLSAEMLSSMAEHKISDVKFEADKLTFKRQTKVQGQEFETTFEGAIQPKTDTLSGLFKSEMIETPVPVVGKHIGSALIGVWNLDVTSGFGASKQRLKVNPDLSGMYGTTPIEKISLEGDKVTFKLVQEFGQRRFEMDFEAKIDGSSLSGELKTQRGAQTVVGKKISSVF
jgi:hypothetical protein